MAATSHAWASARACRASLIVCLVASAATARAVPADGLAEEPRDRPDGVHVLDGSYVLTAGNLHVNITNHGLIGSQYSTTLPYANAPSAQWPAGSGDEYLFGAGLWIGALVDGVPVVTTGQPERELRPDDDLRATIYEAWNGTVTRPYLDDRPRGRRLPPRAADDDGDGRIDEDPLNGYDDDLDGAVDEDFGQFGDQMMVCTMRDDLPLVREIYPSHSPIGVEVVQRAAAWTGEGFGDIVALDFEITNKNAHALDDVYLGFYADCDIQNRRNSSTQPDDVTGFFDGALRDSRGTFHRLQVGWMKDAAPEDPLPGVFGVVLLDHPTDFLGRRAPHLVRVRSYQSFATNSSQVQNGEPRSDEERYALMASDRSDRDAREDRPADFKFLISCGPFDDIASGRTLSFRVALVIGRGMQEMLDNALKASQLQRGYYYDMDNDWATGGESRETEVCLGDYPPEPDGTDPLLGLRYLFMDEACVGSDPVFGAEIISPDNMTIREDGRICIWVNADNCEECFRAVGRECTRENGLFWDMQDYPGYYRALTGLGGAETRVPWIYFGAVPPVPPVMRAAAGDEFVDVFWDDSSEFVAGSLDSVRDFESYRLWRVQNWTRPQGVSEVQGPPVDNWALIGHWDVVSYTRSEPGGPYDRPLGANTGLDPVAYRPACLDDARFAGLAAAMRRFVDADPGGTIGRLSSVRLADGTVRPGYGELQPWEDDPAVLDTFFAVTPREADTSAGVAGKRPISYYTYHDTEARNGFRTYYAVTATDRSGNEVHPGVEFTLAVPRFDAQTPAERADAGANIYVYPNPATRDALEAFDRQFPSRDDPTGMQVVFANLPQAPNVIRIYTAAGDLVDVIHHDGTGAGGGSQAWNLVSRNGQEVTSGIYFFVVHSEKPGFKDVVGRFVVSW